MRLTAKREGEKTIYVNAFRIKSTCEAFFTKFT